MRIWEQLAEFCPALFMEAGPACVRSACLEGDMSCGKMIGQARATPDKIIQDDFPLLWTPLVMARETTAQI